MKKEYRNYKGEIFRIKIADYNKIEEMGYEAGEYLTFNKEIKAWELTDDRNDFNRDRTWKYIYQSLDNKGKPLPIPVYDCIAWSLGYLYTEDQFEKLRTNGKWWK